MRGHQFRSVLGLERLNVYLGLNVTLSWDDLPFENIFITRLRNFTLRRTHYTEHFQRRSPWRAPCLKNWVAYCTSKGQITIMLSQWHAILLSIVTPFPLPTLWFTLILLHGFYEECISMVNLIAQLLGTIFISEKTFYECLSFDLWGWFGYYPLSSPPLFLLNRLIHHSDPCLLLIKPPAIELLGTPHDLQKHTFLR